MYNNLGQVEAIIIYDNYGLCVPVVDPHQEGVGSGDETRSCYIYINSLVTISTTLGVGVRVQACAAGKGQRILLHVSAHAAHALVNIHCPYPFLPASFCHCTSACHAAGSRDIATGHIAVPNCYYSSFSLMWFDVSSKQSRKNIVGNYGHRSTKTMIMSPCVS